MNCQNCKQALPDGAQFCGNCGAQNNTINQPPVTQQVSAPLQPNPTTTATGTIMPASTTVAPTAVTTTTTPQVTEPTPIIDTPPALNQAQPTPIPGVLTDTAKKKIKYFSVVSIVIGILYVIGSIIVNLSRFSDTNESTYLVGLVIDVALGLLILIPGIMMHKATDIKKLKYYVNVAMAGIVFIFALSLASGKNAGVVILLGLIFGLGAISELKKIK